jgi:predicted AlkP superfamily phosphohydrolase/phosphomutase
MRAALPPVSSVSWSSFMTGANPGEHGIFGFTDVDPDSYRLRFPIFSDLATPTFWDRLGDSGLRCAVINQPATYPARALPGALVSGFVALELSKSVWPQEHLRALEGMGYRIDVDTRRGGEDLDSLLDDLEQTLETRRRAAEYFWGREDWDYFQVVVTGTDRLHHFLWPALVTEDDPRHERAVAYYRAVDIFVGEMWDRFCRKRSAGDEGEGFLILSDHGFTGARQEVRLNAWLHDNGYLQYETEEPASVADIAPSTRAFALDPSRIHLNLTGRFAHGSVEESAAPALRQELAARLQELSFEGEPVIAEVFYGEAIYTGRRVRQGPDLVAVSRPGFDLKGTTKERDVFAPARLPGMHTWDDALVWSRLPLPESPEISELAGVLVGWLLGSA